MNQLLFSTAAMSIPAGGMKFLQNAQGNQLHVHGVFGIPQQVSSGAVVRGALGCTLDSVLLNLSGG